MLSAALLGLMVSPLPFAHAQSSLDLIDFVSEDAGLAGIGVADAEADTHVGEVVRCSSAPS